MTTGVTWERRKHERVEKKLPVHVRLGRQVERHPAEILNIGAGGVYIKTELEVDTNDLVSIYLNIPEEPEPIYVYGTVVRVDARGYGVSFIRISEITAELIAYLIRKWQSEGAPPA